MFKRDQFNYHGGYLTYGPENKFIARFKYRGLVKKSDFIRILCKHYFVEDYLKRLGDRAPLQIFMDDGHVKVDIENHRVIVAK
jgi:hypothetical protein